MKRPSRGSTTSCGGWNGRHATRGPDAEGEPAPEAGRGSIQGHSQGGADADTRRPPGVPRPRASGDEGHRRDRLPGIDVRTLRDRRICEGLQVEGRGSQGRTETHPGPQQACGAGGKEAGRSETGEACARAESRETGSRAETRDSEGGAEDRGQGREAVRERGKETGGERREETSGEEGREEGGAEGRKETGADEEE